MKKKRITKKLISILLAAVLSLSVMTIAPFSVSAAIIETESMSAISQSEFDNKISALRSQYPNYSTWYNSFDGGSQCFGFARLMGYSVFGSYPSSWSKDYNIYNVKAGDLIQYGNTSGNGHTVFVTNVSGNTITFVDCNGNGNYSGATKVRSCGIKWDNTVAKGSNLFGYAFAYLISGPGIYSVPNVTNPWISADKSAMVKGDTINFNLGADNATNYTIGIDRNGSRVITQYVGTSASFTINDPGDYSAYVTCYNSVSEIDSYRVYFSVIDTANIGDKFYSKIIHTSSKKAVIGADTLNVEIATEDENKNQVWYFERQSDNSYKIINTQNDKCLDLVNFVTENGNNIQLCTSDDTDAQRWYIIANGNGYSLLSKCNVAKALDLSGGNTADGNNISIFDRNNSAAQIYSISKSVDTSFYTPAMSQTVDNHTYEYYNYTTTWSEAERICNIKGGHLVTITSQEEQNTINNMIGNYPDNFTWAGATDEFAEGSWIWITGEKNDYSNWANSEPNNEEGIENYMTLNVDGTWNDIPVNGGGHKFGFICEYEDIDESQYVPVKFIIYNDNNYEFYDNNVTWEQAKKICEQKGGHLVTIQNVSENNIIYSNVNSLGFSKYWIGYTDRKTEGTFEWVTGENNYYYNWAENEPNNLRAGENYAIFYADSGEWNDAASYYATINNVGFICEYENKTNANNYKPVKTITLNNSTYEFFNNAITWEKAEEICKLKGGNLATITSNLENIMLQETAKELSLEYILLGGTDRKDEGVWKWITDEDFSYTNWAEGEPNNSNNDENYLEMIVKSGQWNDVPNEGTYSIVSCGFVCEYDSTIKPSILGDANGDDEITIQDVTDIQQYLAGTSSLSEKDLLFADVNNDGEVTIDDATIIQTYVAGIISAFTN